MDSYIPELALDEVSRQERLKRIPRPYKEWYVTKEEYRPSLEYFNGRLITKLVKTRCWASRKR